MNDFLLDIFLIEVFFKQTKKKITIVGLEKSNIFHRKKKQTPVCENSIFTHYIGRDQGYIHTHMYGRPLCRRVGVFPPAICFIAWFRPTMW